VLRPTRYPAHDDRVWDVEVDDHIQWSPLCGVSLRMSITQQAYLFVEYLVQ
jgi:hypothetical protein